jgi:tRNA (cmo5U34)-methyltransferase
MEIPKHWTFKNTTVAEEFDSHVREQLPWYDLITTSITHFGRHYIPVNGRIYDIGASTGNIGNALRDVIEHRQATFIAIEESSEMVDRYVGPGTIIQAEATQFDFKSFDFAVLFLVLMFLPISRRHDFLRRLTSLIKPGGCIVIVDKLNTASGYYGTVARRLTMQWKLDNGVSSDDIIKKELSLAGYQRPLDQRYLTEVNAKQFFHFGEFGGWVIEESPVTDK